MYAKLLATVLFLINLASCYRLESQSGDLDINSTSVLLTEEIAGLTDNYEPWREWPDRLFPRFHTSSDFTKPSWTVVTKSKTALPSDSLYSSPSSSPLQTPDPSSVYSSSSLSDASSSATLSPAASDYFGESSSIFLPSISSNILSSHSIESSFNTVDLHTTLNQDPYLTPSIDPSSFTISTSALPSSTPSLPLSSSIQDFSSESSFDSNQFSSISSIDRTDYETISSTSSELASSIQPSPTINLPDSTVHLNETTNGHNPNIPTSTTPLPSDNNLQHHHKTVIIFKQPEGMKNTTIEFEERLKKVFQLAYSRLHGKNATGFDIKIDNLDWSSYDVNKTLTLVYTVKLDGVYLDNETIQKLLSTLSDEDIKTILNANKIISRAEPFTQTPTNQPPTKPDFKLSELLNRDLLFDINGPYFWIMICLFLLIILICCFYLSMLICWLKNRNKKKYDSSAFMGDRKDQLSPISNYSSDTLNTENFIRWRSRPTSTNVKQQQQQSKREKSLFKNDLKTSSLSKLKRKEIGSSPSNEFEYISFSSDTTNSSLQRDGSLNKRTVRHHPYSQDYNRNLSKNYSKQDLNASDFVDYHIPTIQKINQLNQPNSIKLLISRGVQNNLLTDSSNFQTENKKFPLEIPSLNSYYGNTVSVLNLSKEKLIPLNQYHTSDSSTTTTTSNTISDRNDSSSSKQKLINDQQNTDRFTRLSGSNSRPSSRISEPKRLIKKEIIEEFETTTTTTTFKNNNRPNTLDNLNKDAQLNEQTQTIIKAIKDELNKFHYNPK